MNLIEARVGEPRAFFVSTPSGRDIATFGIRREVVHIGITARSQNNGMGRMRFNLARNEISRDNPASPTVDYDDVEQFATRMQLDVASSCLLCQC